MIFRSQIRGFALLALLAATVSPAGAATGLRVRPTWQTRSARVFTVRDGAIFADGEPFPLLFEFTWSSPHSEPFFRYFSQYLGNVHWEPFGLNVGGKPDYRALDQHYADAGRHFVYCCPGLSVAHAYTYVAKHPEAVMRTPDGSPSAEGRASYLDPGYRQALRESLKELADHVRDLPFHFGYYPQDEYSYADWGGYEEASLRVFRERLAAKYGDLAGINRAWGTRFEVLDAVMPPKAPEPSPAWADFQEHRVWAQCDFAAFVTRALHEFDPNHLVIWSLPFWGSPVCAANWWQWPECTDVLMRHGIAFTSGAHRMVLLRDVAESAGKGANALCMPPDYNPDYVQMMFLLAAGRTGLSHVCAGGSPEHTYYQGAADSTRGWERKEPIYTASRNLNALMRTLGPTYLLSKQRAPQVGIFQSERTLALQGIENRGINGVFLLLDDLNLDYRVFSERDVARLREFPAVIVGPFTRCLGERAARALSEYVAAGGNLIFVRGAGEADECNRPAGSPGFGLDALIGSKPAGEKKVDHLVAAEAGPPLPVALPVSCRETGAGAQVLAQTEEGAPVVTRCALGKGRVLYVGADLGAAYQAGWTDDFAGVERPDSAAIDENAFGSWFRPDTAGRSSVALQGHRAWALLLGRFLEGAGVRPWVGIEGVGGAPAAVRARSFRQGGEYWVGFANRVVRKGEDHRASTPDRYHLPFTNLRCAVRLDAGTRPTAAYLLPMNRLDGERQRAFPEVLPMAQREDAAVFTLPRLEGTAAVLLTGAHEPLLGIAADRRYVLPGDQVRVTGRVVNATGKPLAAAVSVDAAEPLAVEGRPVPVSVAAGAVKDLEFLVRVPADAGPQHLLLQVVAERAGAPAQMSPSIELEVRAPVELNVAGAGRTLMPAVEPDAKVVLTGLARVPAAQVALRASVQVPQGFAADPAEATVTPAADGRVEMPIRFSDKEPASRVAAGEVRVAGTVRGRPVELRWPVRLARGTVLYDETQPVRAHSGGDPTPTPMIALENEHVKATFIPGSGVLHDLVLRQTGTDVLVPGEYPFGMVLYAWKGSAWSVASRSADGRRAELRLTATSPDGKPVAMTASLESGDAFVRVEYDFGEAAPFAESFYLMSRVSQDGKSDVMLVPRKSGDLQRKWGQAAFLPVKVADLASNTLTVRSEKSGEALVVAFAAPAIEELSLSSGGSGYNYMLFRPAPATPPGKMRFLLGALQGTPDDARRMADHLLGRLGGKRE